MEILNDGFGEEHTERRSGRTIRFVIVGWSKKGIVIRSFDLKIHKLQMTRCDEYWTVKVKVDSDLIYLCSYWEWWQGGREKENKMEINEFQL